MMTTREYKDQVIDLFKNGSPSAQMWDEMAECVLLYSENDFEAYRTTTIDKAIGDYRDNQ